MDYTQNAKIAQVTEKTLIIGVDIGSESHYARAFNWRGQEYGKKVFHFNDDVDGYKAFKGWIEAHQSRVGAEKVIVGFEPTGHYWFSFGRYVKQMGMMGVHEVFGGKRTASLGKSAAACGDSGTRRGRCHSNLA